MQKIRKILTAVSEKTALPTNQLPTTPIYLADAGPTKQDIEKLKEMISLLQEKRKKIYNFNNFNNYFHVFFFFIFLWGWSYFVYYPRGNYLFKVGKRTLKQCQKSWKKINFKSYILYRISWDHWLPMETCKIEACGNFKTFPYFVAPQTAW